ncbi:MAG: VWA-like domain-containing protein [Peptococcaceae bacterium]|jgi:predicted metal-dependent peptidase|nr:VWA-like domain-containing protein [Peptococcaceae bacterium]
MSKTESARRSKPSVADRLGRIKERWFINEPALLLVVSTHELTPNLRIRGFRCGMGRIEYNLSDAQALSDAELETALKAETIRIMFRHPYRYPPRNASVSYIASNITINELYDGLNLPYKAGDYWSEPKYKKQFFEFYYKALCELFNQESDGGSGQSDANAASQADGSPERSGSGQAPDRMAEGSDAELPSAEDLSQSDDSLSQADDGLSQSDEDLSQSDEDLSQADEDLSQAAEKTELWATDEYFDEKIKEQIQIILGNSKQWGTLSGQLISQLTADMKPVMNYKKVLSGFRASVLSDDRILTRFKPSRRYGNLTMGRRLEFTTSLLAGVDVSASVTDRELKAFFSAINAFFRYGIKNVDVQMFDSELKGRPVTVKKARKTVNITGRGGTSFQPVLNFFKENTKIYDGLIIFTDGYAPEPYVDARIKRRIVWICANKASYEAHKDWMTSRGRCCYID